MVVGDPGYVHNLVGEFANLAAATIIPEKIGRREAEINALQEANIANVLKRALADHRHNSHLVAIVQHRGEIVAELAEDKARISGDKDDGIGVHPVGDLVQPGRPFALGLKLSVGWYCEAQQGDRTERDRTNPPTCGTSA